MELARVDRSTSARGGIVSAVTPQVINLRTWPDVIVPTRETPVAERTMCDDGNDAH